MKFDEKHMMKPEIIDDEVVAYITNNDASMEINNNDLCKFLYKKPMLTVTDEGVLLFYTSTALYAILDGTSCNIVG